MIGNIDNYKRDYIHIIVDAGLQPAWPRMTSGPQCQVCIIGMRRYGFVITCDNQNYNVYICERCNNAVTAASVTTFPYKSPITPKMHLIRMQKAFQWNKIRYARELAFGFGHHDWHTGCCVCGKHDDCYNHIAGCQERAQVMRNIVSLIQRMPIPLDIAHTISLYYLI